MALTISDETIVFIGLIGTIIGIVLSIVAIMFAYLVDRRSDKVSDQTISSLQKIETEVERLSEDTRGLIKAGWDKMLGSVATPLAANDEASRFAKQVTEGLIEEFRSALVSAPADDAPVMAGVPLDRLNTLLERLEESLENQIRNATMTRQPGKDVENVLNRLQDLSPPAQAFASALVGGGHLTFDQYSALMEMDNESVSSAVRELRRSGLLVPLRGFSPSGEPIPVYWFPPGQSKAIGASVSLLDDVSRDVHDTIKRNLAAIEYPPGNSEGRNEDA